MKHIIFSIIILASINTYADELMKDFDSLGGNKILLEQAQALQPDQKVSIVQNRIVSREKRVEVAPEAGLVLGGDSYVQTRSMGLNGHYHFNPRWSLGLKYQTNFNSLSPEAESMINDSQTLGKALVPDIDFPKQQGFALINWYPFYGKVNVLDKGIAHFDVYGLLGYGNVQMKTSTSDAWTVGGGIGFWLSQHLTTRLEMRYQTHKAQRLTGPSQLHLTVASFQMGYMF